MNTEKIRTDDIQLQAEEAVSFFGAEKSLAMLDRLHMESLNGGDLKTQEWSLEMIHEIQRTENENEAS